MLIRKAKPEESRAIASCILLAMEEIVYSFIGEKSEKKAIDFLDSLIQEEGNQYSYENCWVVMIDNQIVAAANVYNGAQLSALKEPVAERIHTMFNKDFNPEAETQAGEFYIDCVGVHPSQQGQGIGTKFLQFLIEDFVHQRNETLGLLVDKDNPNAKKLYLKLGFDIVKEKTFAGKSMEHLQLTRKNVTYT